MGRLARRLKGRRLRSMVRVWVLPIVLSIALLAAFHTTVQADTAPSSGQLAAYLKDHKLEAFSLVKNGYQQVYYRYNDDYIQITKNAANHAYVVANDHYIAWQQETTDGGQIYLYDVLTGAETQLTRTGLNSEPAINVDTVTWRTWENDKWRVNYYNGLGIISITDGTTSSFRASTNGSKIIYAEYLEPNHWRAHEYDIQSKQDTVIKEGSEADTAYPTFAVNNSVTTAFNPGSTNSVSQP